MTHTAEPCIAPPGNLCLDTGCWDADMCVATRMTVEQALTDVHRHFCANDAHDDACRVLTEAIESARNICARSPLCIPRA
jgi:hypothetical protein